MQLSCSFSRTTAGRDASSIGSTMFFLLDSSVSPPTKVSAKQINSFPGWLSERKAPKNGALFKRCPQVCAHAKACVQAVRVGFPTGTKNKGAAKWEILHLCRESAGARKV